MKTVGFSLAVMICLTIWLFLAVGAARLLAR